MYNRGKGSTEALNKALDSDLRNLLDHINPDITKTIAATGYAIVVANSEEFAELAQRNNYFDGTKSTSCQTRSLGTMLASP